MEVNPGFYVFQNKKFFWGACPQTAPDVHLRNLTLRCQLPVSNAYEINAQGWKKRLGLVELGFRIPIVSVIPDSLSCMPDSKAHDFTFRKRFNKQKFLTFHLFFILFLKTRTKIISLLLFPFIQTLCGFGILPCLIDTT